jgi:hypothetical protein
MDRVTSNQNKVMHNAYGIQNDFNQTDKKIGDVLLDHVTGELFFKADPFDVKLYTEDDSIMCKNLDQGWEQRVSSPKLEKNMRVYNIGNFQYQRYDSEDVKYKSGLVDRFYHLKELGKQFDVPLKINTIKDEVFQNVQYNNSQKPGMANFNEELSIDETLDQKFKDDACLVHINEQMATDKSGFPWMALASIGVPIIQGLLTKSGGVDSDVCKRGLDLEEDHEEQLDDEIKRIVENSGKNIKPEDGIKGCLIREVYNQKDFKDLNQENKSAICTQLNDITKEKSGGLFSAISTVLKFGADIVTPIIKPMAQELLKTGVEKAVELGKNKAEELLCSGKSGARLLNTPNVINIKAEIDDLRNRKITGPHNVHNYACYRTNFPYALPHQNPREISCMQHNTNIKNRISQLQTYLSGEVAQQAMERVIERNAVTNSNFAYQDIRSEINRFV